MHHRVYQVLSSKELILGLPRKYYAVVGVVAGLGFNLLGSVFAAGGFAFLAMCIGWILVRIDPDFIDIWLIHLTLTSRHKMPFSKRIFHA